MTATKHRLYHELQRAAHAFKKQADRVMVADAGLTTAQAAALMIIEAEGPVSQRMIATTLGLNESAVTAMVARLKALGYVTRVRSPDDGRAWCLSVTEEGRTALAGTRAPMNRVNARLDAALNPDEMAALAGYLRRISAALSND